MFWQAPASPLLPRLPVPSSHERACWLRVGRAAVQGHRDEEEDAGRPIAPCRRRSQSDAARSRTVAPEGAAGRRPRRSGPSVRAGEAPAVMAGAVMTGMYACSRARVRASARGERSMWRAHADVTRRRRVPRARLLPASARRSPASVPGRLHVAAAAGLLLRRLTADPSPDGPAEASSAPGTPRMVHRAIPGGDSTKENRRLGRILRRVDRPMGRSGR